MPSSAPAAFTGFPRQTVKFLKDLKANNEREWFNPRKADYEQYVRDPMVVLVSVVNERLRKVAVEYVVPDAKKALYRLYRDTRFSKDKTPYKTNVSAYFQRKGYARHAGPGFYTQLDHTGKVGIAGGLYMAGPEEIKAIREAIVKDVKGFEKIFAGRKLAGLMGKVQGEALKRAPKGFESNDNEYVRMKQWYFWTELEAKYTSSADLPKLITERIEAMLPACEWIHDVLQAAAGHDTDNRPKRPEPMF
jgi:uncharacterized protein (TIGR02453 family)